MKGLYDTVGTRLQKCKVRVGHSDDILFVWELMQQNQNISLVAKSWTYEIVMSVSGTHKISLISFAFIFAHSFVKINFFDLKFSQGNYLICNVN